MSVDSVLVVCCVGRRSFGLHPNPTLYEAIRTAVPTVMLNAMSKPGKQSTALCTNQGGNGPGQEGEVYVG